MHCAAALEKLSLLRPKPRIRLRQIRVHLHTPLAQFLVVAVKLNVLLAVFNMIPIPPLDGGNVLAGVLRGPVAEIYDRLRPYGFLILYGLMFTNVLGMIIFPPYVFLSSLLL